jgi:porphobilinogen synthase
MRDLVAETQLDVRQLVAPLFVREGIDQAQPVASLPGVMQHTRASLREEVRQLADLGVRAVILFGVPEVKDDLGSGAFDPQGIVQVALRELSADVGDRMVLMADLCVDEYTSHGHCGVLDGPAGHPHTSVDNDATLEIYGRIAVAQADAGAQVVAPSGMMDGQVGAIRAALDSAGHSSTAILAYSAKYASGLYGPFRDAVDCAIVGGGDRKSYQQDWRNAREAMVEVHADISQGADMVMVKPALSYLDIIAAVKAAVDVPVAAYHVSGEYAMIKAAARAGWIDTAQCHRTTPSPAGRRRLTYLSRWFAEAQAGVAGEARCAPADLPRSNRGHFRPFLRGHPRRRQQQHPRVQSGRRHPVPRRARGGPVRLRRGGHPLHRSRAELRRDHPRPRAPCRHGRHLGRRRWWHVVRRAHAG